jgi:hypothetical protein
MSCGRNACRPELFWRTFKPITGYDTDRDVVFIFKRATNRQLAPTTGNGL